MPPHPTQGPSAYEMGSLIWLKHGAVDPSTAPLPGHHFPRLISLPSFFLPKFVYTQARRRAATVLTTTYRLLRLAAAPSVRGPGILGSPCVSPNCNAPSPLHGIGSMGLVGGAAGRATPLIPRGPAVPTAGIFIVIHITADPPPSILEPRHPRWYCVTFKSSCEYSTVVCIPPQRHQPCASLPPMRHCQVPWWVCKLCWLVGGRHVTV